MNEAFHNGVSEADNRLFAKILSGRVGGQEAELRFYYGDDYEKIKDSVIEARLSARRKAHPGFSDRVIDGLNNLIIKPTLSNTPVQPTKTMGSPSQNLQAPEDRDSSKFKLFDPRSQPKALGENRVHQGDVFVKDVLEGTLSMNIPSRETTDAINRLLRTRGVKIAFHRQNGGVTYDNGSVEALFHEIMGHGLNPVTDSPSYEWQKDYGYDSSARNSPWRTELGNKAYYVSNDHEMSAALGNLRKQMYRKTRVDIGDPKNLKVVIGIIEKDRTMLNKGAFKNLSRDAKMFLTGLIELRNYSGRNLEIKRRKAEVEALLNDANYMNQLVQTGGPKNDNRT